MRGITKVLAVVDTRKDKQLALNRASNICRVTGAALHILAPNPRADSDSMVRLEALAAPLIAEGQKVYLHETWSGSLIETIIHIRQMERCDLVVKDAQLITALQKRFPLPKTGACYVAVVYQCYWFRTTKTGCAAKSWQPSMPTQGITITV